MKSFSEQKITPFLWFNDNAEAAAKFYVSLFKNSKILEVSRYPEGAPVPAGSVMTVTFRLAGQDFIALNGGPHVKFTEAVSLLVNCDTQAEIDSLWKKLGAGGEELQCGWIKDKFGFPWQIAPGILHDLLQDKNRDKASRVMNAMFTMRKIEISTLKKAADDRSGDGRPKRRKPGKRRHEGVAVEETLMIRKLSSGEYRLYSVKRDPKTGKRRNLGTFKTRAAAVKHEREVQFFKRRG